MNKPETLADRVIKIAQKNLELNSHGPYLTELGKALIREEIKLSKRKKSPHLVKKSA